MYPGRKGEKPITGDDGQKQYDTNIKPWKPKRARFNGPKTWKINTVLINMNLKKIHKKLNHREFKAQQTQLGQKELSNTPKIKGRNLA